MRFCYEVLQQGFAAGSARESPSPSSMLAFTGLQLGFWGAEGPVCEPTRTSVGFSCCFAGTTLTRVVKFPLCLGCPRCGDSLPRWRQRVSSLPRVMCEFSLLREAAGAGPRAIDVGPGPTTQPPPSPLTQIVFNPLVSGKGKTSHRKPYQPGWRMTVSSVTCGGRATCPWS